MAEKITNGDMESWASATDLNNWTEAIAGSSTINREEVQVDSGTYSCRFDVDSGSTCKLRQDLSLTQSAPYTITVRAYGDATNTVNVRLLDDSQTVFLKEDGTWNTGQYSLYGGEPAASWNTIVNVNFNAHASYSNYQLIIQELEAAATWTFYIDNVSIIDNPISSDPCLFFGCNF